MNLISLFSGAGGLDIGFKAAGFRTTWANEYDKSITPSFQNYFKDVKLDTRSIREISDQDFPKNIVGVIGGPPCQSWSEAGARRGIEDPRGQLFYEYLRVIKVTRPKFFVAENVSGLLHKKNQEAFNCILKQFEILGYRIFCKLVNASEYQVPQDRHRVIIVGYNDEIEKNFEFPKPILPKISLRESIGDITSLDSKVLNHEYLESGYSPIFLSRNRVRKWEQQSFTILATERHIPFHPDSPPMIKTGPDKMKLQEGGQYRRLTIRECARIQTFPDDYHFIYKNKRVGYKMIGNAVPVKLGYHIACSIKKDL
jgi:DNA (cytosine-5)-methyltransferase 1